MQASCIGTKVEFGNGFYTEASTEIDENGMVKIGGIFYKVGDQVEITRFHGKAVYDFKKIQD
jgi:hypothetical protein